MNRIYLIVGLLSLLLSSCAFDNFDEPKSVIEGRVVYDGQALGLRHNALRLQLYQPGYELYEAFDMRLSHEGTFNGLIFDGTYKLISPAGTTQPWVLRTDTITFELNGSESIDYEVTPYFMVANESFTKSGNNIDATCAINQIVGTSTLENATLYISRTLICDQVYNDSKQELSAAAIGSMSSVNFSAEIPPRLLDQGYCFVRIGVKAAQASERVYSQVQKVSF
ncbi:MAG TPA: DUF3823 domain-containing protein [Draconibacterium sp.]|nr:DUF3823 domain-containing protein [Draconibacterium sp.]